jgi:hypothetical protein
MRFLAPLFLLGLGLIAIPLWLHRLQIKNPKRRAFSSAMLLQAVEQRLRVQKMLRYLLLLAARIGLLTLLALAFAKPELLRLPLQLGRAARLHLIVLDTSLSMSYGERFASAIAQANQIVDGLSASDGAQIISAGGSMESIAAAASRMSADKGALRAALAGLRAGAGRLDFGVAMANLSGFIGTDSRPVLVHFISDMQASGLPARFGELVPKAAPGQSIALDLRPIAADPAPNYRIDSIRRAGDGVDVTVRSAHTPKATLAVVLNVNGSQRGRATQSIDADGTALLHVEHVALDPGDNRVTAQLVPDDLLTLDDLRYGVLQNEPSVPVPMLTLDPSGLTGKYLSAAFNAAGKHYAVETDAVSDFDTRTLSRYRWVLVDDVGALSAALTTSLATYVNDGGSVFASLGARAARLARLPLTNEVVSGRTDALGDPLTVGQMDAGHPLLANLRGWESWNVGRMVQVVPTPDDHVLISASDGRPLLLERRMGRGRVLLLTSTLDNDWNDLPVQPVFVSFIAQTASYLDGRGREQREQLVDATLPLGLGATSQVVDPQGHALFSLAGTRQARSVKLSQLGFYEVYTPGQEALIAVNADPRESDLTPMSPEALERWRVAAQAVQHASDSASVTGMPAPLPLWRWLLPLFAAFVLIESLIGNYYLRRGARTV